MSKRDKSYDKYETFPHVAAQGFSKVFPRCLTDDGCCIQSPINDDVAKMESIDYEHSIFALGAEFGDLARAMLERPNPFISIVRSANVPRLAGLAMELGRELTVDVIPHEENPEGLYGRVKVGPKVTHEYPDVA